MQQFLDFFDSLKAEEKHQVAIEILRRWTKGEEGDLSEEALVEAADELFRNLDAEEASHAPR
jgi:hypothetical protein